MVDQKVSELTAASAATANDLLYLVDEATTSKKITFASFAVSVDHNVLTNTHNLTTDIDHASITNLTYAAAGHTGFASTANLQASYAEIASLALYTQITGSYATIASYAAHVQDTSDPHGSTLSQSDLVSSGIASFAMIKVTGDQAASCAIYTPAFIYDTSATPPTASNYPIGTIYVQYTS